MFMKGGVFMSNLTPSQKISFADKYTSLAIEHNLITSCSEPEETAKEICKLFKTIYENIDPNTTSQD